MKPKILAFICVAALLCTLLYTRVQAQTAPTGNGYHPWQAQPQKPYTLSAGPVGTFSLS